MTDRLITALLAPLLLVLTSFAVSAESTDQKKFGHVTEARVLAEANSGENWLVNGGRFSGEHFSPLSQINTENVSKLGLAWVADIPSPIGLSAEPLVIDGVVYLTGIRSVVYALDAATGKLLWQFDPGVRLDLGYAASLTSRWNRGVAVWDGAVYVGTGDCRLFSIDAEKGTKLWEAPVCDPTSGSLGGGVTGAPRVGDGKVFMGHFGSDGGMRGSLTAFDAKTGKEAWRFWTVPGDPEKGGIENEALEMASKTWTGGWAKMGGGAVWEGIRYDPVTGLVFFGTGSGLPQSVKDRGPGDNLFTNSVVAVDADSGEYRWHYQSTPEDGWNYDATMPKIVTDIELNGVKRRVVFEAPKNGFFYVIDARSGKLLAADAIATVTWASHVDLETGRPVTLARARYWEDPEGRPVQVGPNVWGSHNWHPMSYSPQTGLIYIPVADMPTTWTSGGMLGAMPDAMGVGPDEKLPPDVGRLLAWDPVKREARWTVAHPIPYNGGILSTAGNLVFQGTATGDFRAYAADTGKQLWSRQTGSSIQAAPVSYRLDGDQYILVAIGKTGGISLSAEQRTGSADARGPARVLAFKLGGEAKIPLPPAERAPMPKPPARTASAEQIDQGANLYNNVMACMGCHGSRVLGVGARALGGGIPDLRYAPDEIHAQWNAIVLDGSRRGAGMPEFRSWGLDEEGSQAIRAYVIDQAWKEYEKSHQDPD